MTYCRVKEMNKLPLNEVPWMVKHHAKQAKVEYDERMNSGVVLYVEKGDPHTPEGDDYFEVSQMIANQTKAIRRRLDAVFAGIKRLDSKSSKYETCFTVIEQKWEDRISYIFSETRQDADERLSRCKALAYNFQSRYDKYFLGLQARLRQ